MPNATEASHLATPATETKRKRFSAIWLMPVLAVGIAGAAAWKNYNDRGPLISIDFPSASGIETGKTVLRYRDMEVGVVEKMAFTEDLGSVRTYVRLDKAIAPYVDQDAVFWLVTPKVSARGITGLATVLSGVYIEGNWNGERGTPQVRFFARQNPPLVIHGERGTRIVLRARNGKQLAAGAPILYNGIEVGRLGKPVLSDSGTVVTIEAFVQAPHDRRLTSNTRFWDSSGISLNLGAGGLSVNIESLASLIEGGVTFGAPVIGGERVGPGHVFDVFGGERQAREDAFEASSGARLSLAALLDSDVTGLAPGSTVRFRGAKVGEITDMSGYADPAQPDAPIRLLVSFDVIPAKLGLDKAVDPDAQLAALAARVESGLRVQLASEGLLGQTAILNLTRDPVAPPATLITDQTPAPLIPTTASASNERGEGIDGLVERVGALPFEELMTSAIGALNGVSALAAAPELQQLPATANGLLQDARDLVASDEIRDTLTGLRSATEDLQNLAHRIGQSEGIASLLAALERTDRIARDIAKVTETFPAIAQSTEVITAKFAALPLDELLKDSSAAIARLNSLLQDEALTTLAPSAANAIGSIDRMLAALEQGGTIDNLGTLSADAKGMIHDLRSATSGVPALVEDAAGVIANVRALPLAELSDSLDKLLIRTETLLNAPGIEDIPVALRGSLVELQATMEALRDGGAVESLNQTLASARSAMQAIKAATDQVPGLIDRLNGAAASLQKLIASYSGTSRFYGEMSATLAEAKRTAEAFRSLARSLERNPNALITGRK